MSKCEQEVDSCESTLTACKLDVFGENLRVDWERSRADSAELATTKEAVRGDIADHDNYVAELEMAKVLRRLSKVTFWQAPCTGEGTCCWCCRVGDLVFLELLSNVCRGFVSR